MIYGLPRGCEAADDLSEFHDRQVRGNRRDPVLRRASLAVRMVPGVGCLVPMSTLVSECGRVATGRCYGTSTSGR